MSGSYYVLCGSQGFCDRHRPLGYAFCGEFHSARFGILSRPCHNLRMVTRAKPLQCLFEYDRQLKKWGRPRTDLLKESRQLQEARDKSGTRALIRELRKTYAKRYSLLCSRALFRLARAGHEPNRSYRLSRCPIRMFLP